MAACKQCGETGVTAGANDHIGLKFLKNLLALTHSAKNALDGISIFLQRSQVFTTAEAGCRQALQLITSLGHQSFLHMAFCADEEDIAVGMTLLHGVCHRNGRIDMTGSTAAGKNHVHCKTSCNFV